MGLLDWDVQVDFDDFSFPNFDSSFSPPSSPLDKRSGSFSSTHSSEDPVDHRSSSNSQATSTTTSTSTTTTSSSPTILPKTRERSPSFDLFGDDDELQEAEPRIGFCDICMKDCDIH